VGGGRTCCRTGRTEGRRASAAAAGVGFLAAAVGRSEVDPGTVEVVVEPALVAVVWLVAPVAPADL